MDAEIGHYIIRIHATPATRRAATSHLAAAILPASLGSCLATEAVAPAVAKKQLAVPQLYPLGQQPGTAPAWFPHKYQLLAQVAVGEGLGTALAGTTTVIPPPLTMVV